MAALPKAVSVVYLAILDWENTENVDLFGGLFDRKDQLYSLMQVADGLENRNPPDLATLPNDWALFVLNEFVEWAADTGINNIKSIIKVPDRKVIADAAEVTMALDESLWPLNRLAPQYQLINDLIDPPAFAAVFPTAL